MNERLTPPDHPLHVVRWITTSGRDVKHKYFRRPHDARTFAAKLIAHGKSPNDIATFTTNTTWSAT